MKNSTKLLTGLVAIFLFFSASAQTYNLHWGSTSWVNPSYGITVSNIGGSGINATVAITNSGAGGNTSAAGLVADNNAFQNNTPSVAGTTAFFLPGTTAGNPLVQHVDWSVLTATVTTVITFSRPVDNVSFYLGDMDRTSPVSYIDRFTFTGKKNGVTVASPIVTKFQATASGADTVLISGNTAYGNAALTPNGNAATNSITTQGATINVQFSNPVTEITLLWDQGPGSTGNPAGQAVANWGYFFQQGNSGVSANIR